MSAFFLVLISLLSLCVCMCELQHAQDAESTEVWLSKQCSAEVVEEVRTFPLCVFSSLIAIQCFIHTPKHWGE